MSAEEAVAMENVTENDQTDVQLETFGEAEEAVPVENVADKAQTEQIRDLQLEREITEEQSNGLNKGLKGATEKLELYSNQKKL